MDIVVQEEEIQRHTAHLMAASVITSKISAVSVVMIMKPVSVMAIAVAMAITVVMDTEDVVNFIIAMKRGCKASTP